MSMITRCPGCQTLFKVVPDQLRISEGWVRCGHCSQIFDATPHLLPMEQPSAIPDPVDENEPHDGQPERSESIPDVHVNPEPEAHVKLAGESASSPELSTVSFLLDTDNGSFWRRPIQRVALVFASLALLLGLSVQIAIHERNTIAAFEPGLSPWLAALCVPFNCTMAPLRRIESIVIDSASFNKIRADAYRLNFTIKNVAPVALAVPAVELALTDTLDQPLVRRVFLPSELGVKSNTLAAGSEWSASLALAVKAEGMAERVVGYRLLTFYP
jgi:predicted Zn finger-like uncharacterized protein